MNSFHLKKPIIVVNKEKVLNFVKNSENMKNIKMEEEEEIMETIEGFEDNFIHRRNIKMKPNHIQSEARNSNGNFRKNNHHKLNRYSSYSPKESRKGIIHSNETQSTQNFQTSRKRKLSLRIDTVESLNPQMEQLTAHKNESSPKRSHHSTNRTKEENKSKVNLPNSSHKIYQNGNKPSPNKKLECIPIQKSETYKKISKPKEPVKAPQNEITTSKVSNIEASSGKIKPQTLKTPTSPHGQNQVSTSLKIFKGSDLMCWEIDPKFIRTNEKYEVVYRNMTKKYPLIALFKCMGKNCSYTVDDPAKFLNHLMVHVNENKKQTEEIYKKYRTELKTVFDEHERSKIKLKQSEEIIAIYDYFLFCSYCPLRVKDAKSLVHHINDIHRKDIYQCGFCFFRSCVKETCLEHWERSHKNQIILIYECPGRDKFQIARARVMERLLEKRKQYVVPLICKVCNVDYYPLKEFLKHCEKEHQSDHEKNQIEKCLHVLDEVFKAHGYGMYQCLYCLHGCSKEATISSHLIQHPSEFAFYCMRQPEQASNDPNFFHSIESTRIMEIQKDVKVIEFSEDPELLNRKNYKEIIDSDLQKMLLQKCYHV